MANTTSAKKATRRIERKTLVNKMRRSRVKSHVRKLQDAIIAGDRKAAEIALSATESQIMRAASKGVLHRNTAARKVSRLARHVQKLAAASDTQSQK